MRQLGALADSKAEELSVVLAAACEPHSLPACQCSVRGPDDLVHLVLKPSDQMLKSSCSRLE